MNQQPPNVPVMKLGEWKRTIIIGDVHGCYLELRELLESLQVTESDELIAVGDLINKGPDSRSVMQWAMGASNLRCVLGNHEARFLDQWLLGERPEPGSSNFKTYSQMGDLFEESMQFIDSWPLMIEQENFFVVHAGIDPRVPLDQQSRKDLLNIRVPKGMGLPWYEDYKEERLAVFAHWAKRNPVIRPNAIGLDTGCVYGGFLSALVLPEKRLVSIPSKSVYVDNPTF